MADDNRAVVPVDQGLKCVVVQKEKEPYQQTFPLYSNICNPGGGSRIFFFALMNKLRKMRVISS